MQTFLPYPDLDKSIRCLDGKRLGNQVYREGMTLLRGKWPNHPASKMWRGYKFALCEYLIAGVDELAERGYAYYTRPWCVELYETREELQYTTVFELPPWFGHEPLHASHRANLLRKDPSFYSRYGWKERPAKDYCWPVT